MIFLFGYAISRHNSKEMRRLVSKNIENLPLYVAGKSIEEVEQDYGLKDVIKLASNENPFGPSPKAVEAVVRSVARLNRYPDPDGHRLRERLSQRLGVDKASIVLGNGSDEIFELMVKTFMLPGDEAIIAHPAFLLYEKMVDSAGCLCIKVPLKNMTYDLLVMGQRVSPRTKFVFINNPNNPTGTIVLRKSFEEFLNHLPQDIIVILDEAYREFVQDRECPDGKNYMDSRPYVVSVRTFSKAYGLAGLRVGYGLMSPELANYVNRIRQPFNVNLLAQVGAEAALQDDEFLQKTCKAAWNGLSYLYEELDNMGLEYIPSQANFLLVHVKTDGMRISKELLRLGVIVRSLNEYNFNDYIRVTVGLPRENKRFIKALRSVI